MHIDKAKRTRAREKDIERKGPTKEGRIIKIGRKKRILQNE